MAQQRGNSPVHLRAVLLLSLALPAFSERLAAREGENFGQVAAKVANLLQHEHYNDQPVNDKVSSDMLDNYLEFLDMGRMYFLQSDIDAIDAKDRTKLDDLLLMQNVTAAQEIYDIYKERVTARIKKVQELIKTQNFTFDSNASIQMSRKDAKWPADEAAADELRSRLIENELLQEVLRVEIPDKLADSSAEDLPEVEEPKKADEAPKDPKEVVSKRYDRILESIAENSPEEIVGFFLKALAHSYDPHSEYSTESEYEQLPHLDAEISRWDRRPTQHD